MSLRGPIILVEDDQNDIDAITEGIKGIGVENEILAFENAEKAYQYLITTKDKPFIILCDIKMPGVDGLSFRKRMIETPLLKKKSIPFIFLTVYATQDIINHAYDLDVQGFYCKQRSFEKLKEQLLTICVYWRECLHPNR